MPTLEPQDRIPSLEINTWSVSPKPVIAVYPKPIVAVYPKPIAAIRPKLITVL